MRKSSHLRRLPTRPRRQVSQTIKCTVNCRRIDVCGLHSVRALWRRKILLLQKPEADFLLSLTKFFLTPRVIYYDKSLNLAANLCLQRQMCTLSSQWNTFTATTFCRCNSRVVAATANATDMIVTSWWKARWVWKGYFRVVATRTLLHPLWPRHSAGKRSNDNRYTSDPSGCWTPLSLALKALCSWNEFLAETQTTATKTRRKIMNQYKSFFKEIKWA